MKNRKKKKLGDKNRRLSPNTTIIKLNAHVLNTVIKRQTGRMD